MTVILDIEGTICSISFVKDVLYPYALESLSRKLQGLSLPIASSDPIGPYLADFPPEYSSSADTLLEHVQYLTKNDIKAPYWKALQGYLWKDGYLSGEIKAPIFPDAIDFISKHQPVVIFSSGSIAAQKLLFAHVANKGDMNSLISHYFDTTTAGSKLESGSYDKIAKALGESPEKLTFYSDNVKELYAAKGAGFNPVLVIRPGNAPVSAQDLTEFQSIKTFEGES